MVLVHVNAGAVDDVHHAELLALRCVSERGYEYFDFLEEVWLIAHVGVRSELLANIQKSR